MAGPCQRMREGSQSDAYLRYRCLHRNLARDAWELGGSLFSDVNGRGGGERCDDVCVMIMVILVICLLFGGCL